MGELIVVLLVLAGLALVGVTVWQVLRQIRIGKLKKFGWAFTSNPGPSPAFGLNCPPFGLGEKRRVRDLITGEHAGTPFKVFRYGSDSFDAHVLVLPLPRPYPEFYLRPPVVATGFQLPAPDMPLVTTDEDFGRALAGAVPPDPGLQLVVDGAALVVPQVPEDPEGLHAAVDRAVQVHREVLAALPADAPAPPVPAELSVFRHPDWTYRERDDDVLTRVRHSGSGGEARRVLSGVHRGLTWVALTHHWTTTTTSTDSQGRTQTHTHHHQEDLFELLVPPGFGNLSINRWRLLRSPVDFESIQFNARSPIGAVTSDLQSPPGGVSETQSHWV
ncbi:hypothetical protein HJ590_08635 [Naumannella sp. ID2617S]|nr:hypothetical protein [Naumannella sp. ID2617S]